MTWYNGERLHSALDYVSPAEYEGALWRSKEQTPRPALTKITGSLRNSGQLRVCGRGVRAGPSGQPGPLSEASGRIRTDATMTWRRPVGEEGSCA
ncbi:hypothetical protein ACFYM7_22810 [Streptomyces cyaneofuscatus]|uniref:hypothetical protein n=1 Tax=Streptomyces TaxID=1883 RepID=UPI003683A0B7